MPSFYVMKEKIFQIIGIVLIAAGFLIFLSPELIYGVQNVQTKVFVMIYEKKYVRDGNIDTKEEEKRDIEQDCVDVKNTDPLYQEIVNYNQSIYLNGQSGFSDPWGYEQSPIDMDGFENGVFGYIELPSIEQTFELYIGATMDNMSKGVAIMGQTSLPIGGENTNCVIAGHRGYNRNKTFFKEIEEIQIGDMIYIRNPWEKLSYKVESIDVIDPYDIDAVRIQEGQDMITLLTCHPYGSHGRYRYLVYCTRYEESADEKVVEAAGDAGMQFEENNAYSDYIVASDGTVYPSSKMEIKKETLFRRACAGVILMFVFLIFFRKISDGKWYKTEIKERGGKL
ncbi:MAG: class C sortase [Coprococcus sp.]